jgi:hypothetical protein
MRKTRVQFPAAEFCSELGIWGDAPSVFVVALSCYDLWFLAKAMRVSDLEMLIRCFFLGEAD